MALSKDEVMRMAVRFEAQGRMAQRKQFLKQAAQYAFFAQIFLNRAIKMDESETKDVQT